MIPFHSLSTISAVIKAHQDIKVVFLVDSVICWNRKASLHHVSRTNTRCQVIHSHMSRYYEDQHTRTSQGTAYLTDCIKPMVTMEWLHIKQRHLRHEDLFLLFIITHHKSVTRLSLSRLSVTRLSLSRLSVTRLSVTRL